MGTIMKARHGRIARLPKEIREQLNHRLENGWRANLGANMKTNNVKITALGCRRLKVDNGISKHIKVNKGGRAEPPPILWTRSRRN